MQKQLNVQELKSRIGISPIIGFVLGSGYGGILKHLDSAVEVPYSEIEGIASPTVPGHAGLLVAGLLGGCPIVALKGRLHYYEGYTMDQITALVRLLKELGIQDLVLTNAAGGINTTYKPGDFMLLRDHINFMGMNPLRGWLKEEPGRFVDLTKVYDPELGLWLKKAADFTDVIMHEGTYLAVSGPSYETPAEIKAFGLLGADAVGMSTVPEAIVARQCGLRVAAVSCITNMAAGLGNKAIHHAEVLDVLTQVHEKASALISVFLSNYAKNQ